MDDCAHLDGKQADLGSLVMGAEGSRVALVLHKVCPHTRRTCNMTVLSYRDGAWLSCFIVRCSSCMAAVWFSFVTADVSIVVEISASHMAVIYSSIDTAYGLP